MNKEIRIVDAEKGIVQITCPEERWYSRVQTDPRTGLPTVMFRPSVTYICNNYPKGKGFEIWLKKHGTEADEIRDQAGERGYRVHRAIAALNDGERVSINDSFENDWGQSAPLSVEEYAAVQSYWEWWENEGNGKLEIINSEYTLWPNAEACELKYGIGAKYFSWAGTVDLKVRRIADNTVGIIDMKTSPDIWMSHRMQVTAYKRGEGADWAAILRLNYKRNKTKKFKWDEIEDCYDVFVATWVIWQNETAGVEPLQRDFPLSLKLTGVEPPDAKKNASAFSDRLVAGRSGPKEGGIPRLPNGREN